MTICPRFRPALLLPALLLLACSRQPTASSASRFAASPPAIDGQASDWADSLRYDPASKLQYQVLNDGRTLYVRLKAADAATQARIVRRGLTVWLDTTGRNQHQFGVRFPLGGPPPGSPGTEAPPSENPGAPAADRQAARHARIAQALAGLREMELLNYKGSKEATLTDAQSQLGVKAALAADASRKTWCTSWPCPCGCSIASCPRWPPARRAVVGVTLAGGKFTMPGNSSVASPDGSVVGNQGNMGMRGGYGGGGYGGGMRGGGYGVRGGYGGGYSGENISLKTSVQLSGEIALG